MINEPITHETHYPPSASAGADNAYYLKGCETVERSPAYASCLFKIAEITAGRESDYTRECANGMRTNKCRAVGLQEEEKLKGRAMYFFPRRSPDALHLPFKVAGDFGVRITNLTDPALIPPDRKASSRSAPLTASKPKPGVDLDVVLGTLPNDYATAINAAIADLPPEPDPTAPVEQKPAAVAKPPAPPTPPPTTAPAPRAPMQPGETPLQYARRLAALKNPT